VQRSIYRFYGLGYRGQVKMGPFLLAHFMQQHQQRQLIVAQGDQAMREAEILKNRRGLLLSAQQHATQLVQESSTYPQRTFVRLSLVVRNLEYYGVVPDSFEDKQEKEEVVLFWRRLSNLWDKTRSLQTDEQLAQCQDCLDAYGMEYFLQTVANRLKPYEEYQAIKPRCEEVWRLSRQLSRYQNVSSGVVIFLILGYMAFIFYVMYTSSGGVNPVSVVLAVLLFVSVGIVYWVYERFESRRPQDLKELDQRFHQLSAAAQIDDQEFWQSVKDKFDGIPTMEQLKQSWDEQEAKIGLIFGEFPTSPSSEQSEASPSDQ
jgi:hypothetical protein